MLGLKVHDNKDRLKTKKLVLVVFILEIAYVIYS